MSEDEELIKQAKKIKRGYASVMEDEDEEQLGFLDEINNLLRIIFKDAPVDVYTVLSQGQLEKWKKQKYKRLFNKFLRSVSIRGILYFILLATITAFLVSEALPFYAIAGMVTAKTYIKAILTEVCFIFLSGYRSKGIVETLSVGILRVAIFCLMLFVITSEVAMQGTNNIAKIDNIAIQIETIEKEIDDKEKTIVYYKGLLRWPTTVKEMTIEKDKLSKQLRELKNRQIDEGASKEVSTLISYQTYGKSLFRLILMFISILVSRRIFRF